MAGRGFRGGSGIDFQFRATGLGGIAKGFKALDKTAESTIRRLDALNAAEGRLQRNLAQQFNTDAKIRDQENKISESIRRISDVRQQFADKDAKLTAQITANQVSYDRKVRQALEKRNTATAYQGKLQAREEKRQEQLANLTAKVASTQVAATNLTNEMDRQRLSTNNRSISYLRDIEKLEADAVVNRTRRDELLAKANAAQGQQQQKLIQLAEQQEAAANKAEATAVKRRQILASFNQKEQESLDKKTQTLNGYNATLRQSQAAVARITKASQEDTAATGRKTKAARAEARVAIADARRYKGVVDDLLKTQANLSNEERKTLTRRSNRLSRQITDLENLVNLSRQQAATNKNLVQDVESLSNNASRGLSGMLSRIQAIGSRNGVNGLDALVATLRTVGPVAFSAAVGLGMLKFTEYITNAAKFAAEVEYAEAAIKGLTGSARIAGQVVDDAFATSLRFPIAADQYLSGARTLLAVGNSTKTLNKDMELLSTIAIASKQPLSDISVIWGEILTKNRLYREDLLQFSRRGIPIAEELAKGLGKTRDELNQLVTDGRITFEVFRAGLQRLADRRFGNLVPEIQASTVGNIQKISNAANSISRDIGNIALDQLAPQIRAIADYAGQWASYISEVSKGMRDAAELQDTEVKVVNSVLDAHKLTTVELEKQLELHKKIIDAQGNDKSWLDTAADSMTKAVPGTPLSGVAQLYTTIGYLTKLFDQDRIVRSKGYLEETKAQRGLIASGQELGKELNEMGQVINKTGDALSEHAEKINELAPDDNAIKAWGKYIEAITPVEERLAKIAQELSEVADFKIKEIQQTEDLTEAEKQLRIARIESSRAGVQNAGVIEAGLTKASKMYAEAMERFNLGEAEWLRRNQTDLQAFVESAKQLKEALGGNANPLIEANFKTLLEGLDDTLKMQSTFADEGYRTSVIVGALNDGQAHFLKTLESLGVSTGMLDNAFNTLRTNTEENAKRQELTEIVKELYSNADKAASPFSKLKDNAEEWTKLMKVASDSALMSLPSVQEGLMATIENLLASTKQDEAFKTQTFDTMAKFQSLLQQDILKEDKTPEEEIAKVANSIYQMMEDGRFKDIVPAIENYRGRAGP